LHEGAKSGENYFFPVETKKTTAFAAILKIQKCKAFHYSFF